MIRTRPRVFLLLLILTSCAGPVQTPVVDDPPALLDSCPTPSPPDVSCGLPPPAVPLY